VQDEIRSLEEADAAGGEAALAARKVRVSE
jgi:hypothetical protein